MLMFSEQPKPVEKIQYGDIKFLTEQLESFIKIYKKKVLMDDNRYYQVMTYLEDILYKLKAGKYDMLIADTSIISYEEDEVDNYPF